MVAKLRGSGARSWSTFGSGLAHTASHSAVWIDFALEVAGESATATTNSIRSLRIVTPRPRATSRRLDAESTDSTPRRARSIPSCIPARYLLGGRPAPPECRREVLTPQPREG